MKGSGHSITKYAQCKDNTKTISDRNDGSFFFFFPFSSPSSFQTSFCIMKKKTKGLEIVFFLEALNKKKESSQKHN